MNIVFCKENMEQTQRYAGIVKRICKHNDIQVSVQTYSDAQVMLFGIAEMEFQIDLLFVDVRINHMTGNEMVETLRARGFQGEVIFLTRETQEWPKAFDIHAFHYIIEQECEEERFTWILTEAFKRILARQQENIAFFCAAKRVVVPVRNIKYFEVRGRWMWVYYDDQSFEFYSRMDRVEQNLLGKGFIRIHRSFLVAIRHVSSIRFDQLTLDDGTQLPIARGKYQKLKTEFERVAVGDTDLV